MILYNNTLPQDSTFRSNSYNYCIKKVLRKEGAQAGQF